MKPKAVPDPAIDAALTALSTESDRGAAVLAGSLVENALGQLLERHCRYYVGTKIVDRLFGATGPVTTFSQRSLVAAAFGLIDRKQNEQLDLVRTIRNHFAHHPLEASFADELVQNSSKSLHFYPLVSSNLDLQAGGMARMAYLMTCSRLLGQLNGAREALDVNHNE